MTQKIILDTGPLVAYIDKSDRFHNWAQEVLQGIPMPLFTCEAVISEACFLLRKTYGGKDAVMSLVKAGIIEVPFRFSEEVDRIDVLMKQYQSVPMSFADGCLVRMTELISGSSVLTLDRDFQIYRKNRNEAIALLISDEL
ncbi:MAG: PIN domain-containing protein [Cyanobacteriota bacterium]|nr:PIN domain-containing protein [Cyanobacteriota bacterium]